MLSFLGIFSGLIENINASFELANYTIWNILETIMRFAIYSMWDFLSHISSFIWWWLKSVFVAPEISTQNLLNLFILVVIVLFGLVITIYLFKGREKGEEGLGKMRSSLKGIGDYIFRGFFKYIIVGASIFVVLFGLNFLIKSILGEYKYGSSDGDNKMTITSERLLKQHYDIEISILDNGKSLGEKISSSIDFIGWVGKKLNTLLNIETEAENQKNEINNNMLEINKYALNCHQSIFRDTEYGKVFTIYEKDSTNKLKPLLKETLPFKCGTFSFKKNDLGFFGENSLESLKNKKEIDLMTNVFLWRISKKGKNGSGMEDVISLKKSNNPQAISFISTLFNGIKAYNSTNSDAGLSLKNHWVTKFLNHKDNPSLDIKFNGNYYTIKNGSNNNIANSVIEAVNTFEVSIKLKKNPEGKYGFFLETPKNNAILFVDFNNDFIRYKNGKLFINDFGLLLNMLGWDKTPLFSLGNQDRLETGFLAGNYFIEYNYTFQVSGLDNYTFNDFETERTYKYTPAFASDLLFLYNKGYKILQKSPKSIKEFINEKVFLGEVVSLLDFMKNEEYTNYNKLFSFNVKHLIGGMKKLAGDNLIYKFDYIPYSQNQNNGFYLGKERFNNIERINVFNSIGKTSADDIKNIIEDEDYNGLLKRFGFVEEINKYLYRINTYYLNNKNSNPIYNNNLFVGDKEEIFTTNSKSGWAILLLILVIIVFRGLKGVILKVLSKTSSGNGGSGGKKKVNVWNLNGLFMLLFLLSLIHFAWIYSFFIYVIYFLLFVGVLLLRRKTSLNFLKAGIDSTNNKLKQTQKEIARGKGKGKKMKALFQSQTLNLMNGLNRGVKRLRKIGSEDEGAEVQGGAVLGKPLIILGIQLIIFFIFTALSYKVGEISAINLSGTGNPLDLGYKGGLFGFVIMLGSFIVGLSMQSKIAGFLSQYVLAQLTNDKSLFNNILRQNANISTVDKMMAKGIEVDKIIGKKITGKDGGLDKMANRKSEELAEKMKKEKGLEKYSSLDKQLENIHKKAKDAGGNLKEEIKNSINSVMGFKEMQENLSGYKKVTAGYLGKNTGGVFTKIFNKKNGNIEKGASISQLIKLSNLTEGKKVSEVYDNVFDMLRKGKQNMFLMNTKYALDNMSIDDKLNKQGFMDKLESYGFQLKDKDKDELELIWDTFQKGGGNLLGELLNVTKDVGQKYGKDTASNINKLIKDFIKNPEKGGDMLVKLKNDLLGFGLTAEEVEKISKEIEQFDKNYTNMGIGFNNEMIGKVFGKSIKTPISNKLNDILGKVKGTPQENNVKKIKSFLEKNNTSDASNLFNELEKAGITTSPEYSSAYKEIKDLIDLSNNVNTVWKIIREGGNVSPELINTLKNQGNVLLDGKDQLSFVNFIEKLEDISLFTKGIDNFSLKSEVADITSELHELALNKPLYSSVSKDIRGLFTELFKGNFTAEQIAKKLETIPIFDKTSPVYKSLSFDDKNSVKNDWIGLIDLVNRYVSVRDEIINDEYGFNEVVSTFLQNNTAEVNTEEYINNIRENIDANLFEAIDPNSEKTIDDFYEHIDMVKGQYLNSLGYESVFKLSTVNRLLESDENTDLKTVGDDLFTTLLKNKSNFDSSTSNQIEAFRVQFKERTTRDGQIETLWNLKNILDNSFTNRDMGGVPVKEMITDVDSYFEYIKGIAKNNSDEAKEIFKKKSKIEFTTELTKNTNNMINDIQKSVSSIEDGSITNIERDNLLIDVSNARGVINNLIKTTISPDNIDDKTISGTVKNFLMELEQKKLLKYINKETLGKNMGQIVSTLYSEKVKNSLLENKNDNKSFIDTFYRLEKDIESVKSVFEQGEFESIFSESEKELLQHEIGITIGEKFLADKDANLFLEIKNATGEELENYKSLLYSKLLPKEIKENISGLILEQEKNFQNDISSFQKDKWKKKNKENVENINNRVGKWTGLLGKINDLGKYGITANDSFDVIKKKIKKSELLSDKEKGYIERLLGQIKQKKKGNINGENFMDTLNSYSNLLTLSGDLRNLNKDEETVEQAILLQSLQTELEQKKDFSKIDLGELIQSLEGFKNSSVTSLKNTKEILDELGKDYSTDSLLKTVSNENIYFNILNDKIDRIKNFKNEINNIEEKFLEKVKEKQLYSSKIKDIPNFDNLNFKSKLKALGIKNFQITNDMLKENKSIASLNISKYSDIEGGIKNFIGNTVSTVAKKTNTKFSGEETREEFDKIIKNKVVSSIAYESIPSSIKNEIATLTNNRIKNINNIDNIKDLYKHIGGSIDGEAKKAIFKEIIKKSGVLEKIKDTIDLNDNELGQNIFVNEFDKYIANNIKEESNNVDKIANITEAVIDNISVNKKQGNGSDSVEKQKIKQEEKKEIEMRIQDEISKQKDNGGNVNSVSVANKVIQDIKKEEKELENKNIHNEKDISNIQKQRIIEKKKEVVIDEDIVDEKTAEVLNKKAETESLRKLEAKNKQSKPKKSTDSMFDFMN